MKIPLSLLVIATLLAPPVCGADWPTNRANPQRTGCADDKPGPQSPKVLWVYESQDHFIASPVASESAIYVSGLAGLGTAEFFALAPAANSAKRELWCKRAPFLRLPVACAPAVADGKIVFGDGMHQTDGATLYCLKADTGTPLWQYPAPGALVHLEGSPTIANGRVYIGGGAAGVLCVDLNTVTLDGKEQDSPAIQAAIEAKWKDLLARYEADKKKDPDFAIPPTENDLPKPQPKRLWQVGQDRWHVDAAVAVVDGRVLAASAKLEAADNFAGERALFCLDANDGSTKWTAPLDINPWAGPTVSGKTVIVGCSSVRFDPKTIPRGRGQVVAVNLDDGRPLWKKDVAGGVVSPVAAIGDLAVFTATDGKVRAFSLADGQEKWTFDAKTPFFAAPAAAGDTIYVADLKAVVHAVRLADGKELWKLDLATDPAVKAPGMVFGSPILADGKLYLATCNTESSAEQTKTVVVCIGG
jgi:outer membrane protein assembly factor BamB